MARTLAIPLLALLIGGCPRRQTTPRVVYVQAAAPAAGSSPQQTTTAHGAAETLTIQEPPPAPQAEAPAPLVPAATSQLTPVPKTTRRRPPNREVDEASQPEPSVPETTSSSPSPQLQPMDGQADRETTAARLEARLREVSRELGDLERQTLSEDELRTLQDAGGFRTQALDAIHRGDLLRATQLTEKAEQLLKAVPHR